MPDTQQYNVVLAKSWLCFADGKIITVAGVMAVTLEADCLQPGNSFCLDGTTFTFILLTNTRMVPLFLFCQLPVDSVRVRLLAPEPTQCL